MAGGIGEEHKNAKLTARTVWEIRRIYNANTDNIKYGHKNGQMQRWLSRKFKIPFPHIQKIVYNTVWKKPAKGMSWADWEKENGLDGGTST